MRFGRTVWTLVALALVPIGAAALPARLEFAPGDPIRASDINANFGALWQSVTALESAGNHVPVGTIVAYFGDEAPAGWLVADGRDLSTEANPEYAELVTHLQDMGRGLSANSASLPDLRGVFLRGQDRGRGIDPDAGDDAIGRLQSDQLAAHSHGASAASVIDHDHSVALAGGAHQHVFRVRFQDGNPEAGDSDCIDTAKDCENGFGMTTVDSSTSVDGGHTHSGRTGGAGAHSHAITIAAFGGLETRPRNITVLYLIRY